MHIPPSPTDCVTPTLWRSGKGQMMETVKGSVVTRGWGEGGMDRQSTEDVYSCETIPDDTTMVDTCHYEFTQIHGMHNTKSEP